MSSIKLTKLERSNLEKHHRIENERKLADRIKTILLLDSGWTYSQIAKILLLDDQSIRNYEKRFLVNGIQELLTNGHKGGFSKLSPEQENELIDHVKIHCYHNSKALINYVSDNYYINYSHSGMVDLLHRLGFTYKKPKIISGKADAEKQLEYLENKLRPALDKASAETPLYFADGVHPTHNVQPQCGWILKGTDKEIRTNSGRQRININGAFCFHTMDLIYREDSTINRFSTLNLLKQVRNAHDSVPITCILDNAGYNKAKEVTEYANENNINLLFLPPYSPNLNLIERLWRFFKKKVCSQYYEKFKQFKNAVFEFFDDIGKYKIELSSLLIDKFQIIGNL